MKIVVNKSKKMIRPGLDKLRHEHLQILVGRSAETSPDEELFCSLLATILTLIAQGKVPDMVAKQLHDNELMALPKNNTGDVRPIGIGSTYRKLASICVFNKIQDFNALHFDKFQYGLKSNGIEDIVHSINRSMRENPSWDMYAIDADNAFNRANRVFGLQQVQKFALGLLPFLRQMYMDTSNGWFHGMEDGITSIQSTIGYDYHNRNEECYVNVEIDML